MARFDSRWFSALLVFLLGLGCRLPVRVVYATPTSAPAEIITLLATDTPTPTLASTPAPPPTSTPLLIIVTATPTLSFPTVTFGVEVNARLGPGNEHAGFVLIQAGSTYQITGRSIDGGWWQIRYPGAPDEVVWVPVELGTVNNADEVPVAANPAALVQLIQSNQPPSSTPISANAASATPTPGPPTPAVDFTIIKQRLWTNEENGGVSFNGSANTCGFGHEIYVTVIDAAGRPLDGIVIADTYDNPRRITGSIGPGRAQYVLYGNGYNLFVAEDQSAGRSVTSDVGQVLSAKDPEIPIPWLINGHYCADEAECEKRVREGGLCWGHYSYDIIFQRSW